MIMRVTRKMARQILEVLDELRKELKSKQRKLYPYAEWERKRELVKRRLRKLPEYVRMAAAMLEVEKGVGRPKNGSLVQRTMLFLFARLMNKSNRDVEELLELFEPLFGFKLSYKSVERLYSDQEVKAVLHNLFILLLQDEGVSGSFSGDGTGYSLAITKHYSSSPKKASKDYRYVFRLIDLQTGMYVAFGYSRRSEKEAFNKAMDLVEKFGVNISRISLDKYYSSKRVLRLFGNKTAVFIIPRKNISRIGFEWARVIKKIIEDPVKFLKDYFMRNLSESGFSSDKRRFGGVIRQKREDRQDTAMLSIALLHNIFFVRVSPN
ncbi:MAG: ISNCY family transposase [Candidatus Thermoplasmatota archaeon]|nr:ISNCY family transposase [Candidatus Thermoplasmatota archaeon]